MTPTVGYFRVQRAPSLNFEDVVGHDGSFRAGLGCFERSGLAATPGTVRIFPAVLGVLAKLLRVRPAPTRGARPVNAYRGPASAAGPCRPGAGQGGSGPRGNAAASAARPGSRDPRPRIRFHGGGCSLASIERSRARISAIWAGEPTMRAPRAWLLRPGRVRGRLPTGGYVVLSGRPASPGVSPRIRRTCSWTDLSRPAPSLTSTSPHMPPHPRGQVRPEQDVLGADVAALRAAGDSAGGSSSTLNWPAA